MFGGFVRIHYFCSMKRLFLLTVTAWVAVMGLMHPLNVKAQEADQPLQRSRVVTNGFLSNWFVQGGLQWNKNEVWKPFQGKLALGKWWSPTIGTRLALGGLKGNTLQLSGYSINEGGCYEFEEKCDFSYFAITGDVLFNLTNIVMGYQEDRLWNLIPFCGPAIARNCTCNEYALGLEWGLLNTFRINRRLAAHAEIGWQRLEDSFNANFDGFGWKAHNHRFYAEVGLTLNLGKQTGWQKAPDVEAVRLSYEAEIEALNAQLEDANAEIDRLTNGGAEE